MRDVKYLDIETPEDVVELAGYLRVSTEAQLDGYGLAAQRQAIEVWATANGHSVALWCEDHGVSGTVDALDRPGLSCVFAALANGDADGVVVARLDRLARQLTTQEAILAALWRDDVTVFAADTGEVPQDDALDPMRTAMRQMAGVFAQLDRALIIKRLRAGRDAKRAAGGKPSGAYPFGLSKDGPVAREQEVLAVIRDLRASGATWEQVADELNRRGLRPRHAERWSKASAWKVGKCVSVT